MLSCSRDLSHAPTRRSKCTSSGPGSRPTSSRAARARWYAVQRVGLATTPVEGDDEQRHRRSRSGSSATSDSSTGIHSMVVTTCELEFRQLLSGAAVEFFEPRRFTATRRPIAQLRKRRPSPEVDGGRRARPRQRPSRGSERAGGLLAPSARSDERRYRRLMPGGHIRPVGFRSTSRRGASAGAAPHSGGPCCSRAVAAHPTARRRADRCSTPRLGHAASAVNTTRSLRPVSATSPVGPLTCSGPRTAR